MTIFILRNGYDGDWTTYQGVLSDLELIIKLTEDLDDKQQEMIVRETFIGDTSEILSKQTLTIVFICVLCYTVH